MRKIIKFGEKEYITLKQTTMEDSEEEVIDDILKIVNENFYELFQVEAIITKAVPAATKRTNSLILNEYKPINRKFMIYDDYYVKTK